MLSNEAAILLDKISSKLGLFVDELQMVEDQCAAIPPDLTYEVAQIRAALDLWADLSFNLANAIRRGMFS